METSVASMPVNPALKTRQRCSWTAEEKSAWVADWEKSGETLAEFCRRNDLPSASLGLWTRQLRGPTLGTSEPGGFVEIPPPPPPEEPAPSAPRESVRVRVADRVEIELPLSAAAAVWLAQLVRNLS